MEYVFTGFRQVETVRHYTFQTIAADRSREEFTVAMDVLLLRKYAIALQEMPLLCRRFLQEREGRDHERSLTLSEEEIRGYANTRAALLEANARKRKPHRAPVPNKAGQAWRGDRPTNSV